MIRAFILGISLLMSSMIVAKPACEDLAGEVVFKDMLYGIAGGGILAGLIMLSASDATYASEKLAVGGLVGSGFGLGAGVLELGLRQCGTTVMQLKQTAWLPYFDQNGRVGVSFKWMI